MRSKFMVRDAIVNAIRPVRIQKLLFVRLVFNCATNHACQLEIVLIFMDVPIFQDRS
jgi:hypothetical protein